MKALALWIFVLSFILFSSANIAAEREEIYIFDKEYIDICDAKNGVSKEDIFSKHDMDNEVYKLPENEQRKRRFACSTACLLRKEGVMVGSDIKEDKFRDLVNKGYAVDDPVTSILRKKLHGCVKEANHLTDDCDKAFAFIVCIY